jgi:hypothetical protein
MAMRKVQLYLTEAQYRLLKQRAGKTGSIAQVVRDLVDGTGRPDDPQEDPFFKHVMAPKPASGDATPAGEAKRDLYNRQR